MLPFVDVKDWLVGSNTSAVAMACPVLSSPPVTSTFPSASKFAVCHSRAVAKLPSVGEKLPVVGSYNSASASTLSVAPVPWTPPVKSTFPELSRVAVCETRAVAMLPVGANVPVAGSNSSAVALPQPATSTLPVLSNVAVLLACTNCMLPVVAEKVPVLGSYSSAVARGFPAASNPPVTSTFPLGSNVAA